MNCIFCEIIEGKIPSYTLYEDELVKVFLDVHPDSNGHTLIIPKQHYQDLFDIPNNTLIHILDVARKISHRLEEKLNSNGITLIQNNGDIQEIKHFHLHLKPYYLESQEIINVEDVYNQIMY